MNIKRLMDIGSYRGIRHRSGLPLRGQRTKNNSRTRKGKKNSCQQEEGNQVKIHFDNSRKWQRHQKQEEKEPLRLMRLEKRTSVQLSTISSFHLPTLKARLSLGLLQVSKDLEALRKTHLMLLRQLLQIALKGCIRCRFEKSEGLCERTWWWS